MLRERQSIAHLGMLSNIYFLPLSSHTTVLLVTAIASLILIFIALTSVVAAVIRRWSKKVRGSESSVGTIRKLTGMIALTTAGAFVCAFAFLPGGPLFHNTLLRVAFTVLAGIVTAATLISGFQAVRLLHDAAVPILRKMQALLAVTSAVALTIVMLGFWVPVSWRSSDGGIDRVAKRVHAAGIFVQSTLVAYDTCR